MSVSHSAAVDCENLVWHLVQVGPKHLDCRWALVTWSLNDTANANILKERDSITIDFKGSAYAQSDRIGEVCQYHPHKIIGGPQLKDGDF